MAGPVRLMIIRMMRSGVFSDEVWAVVEPCCPLTRAAVGSVGLIIGGCLEGIAWRYRVGAPWRDLPAEFGPWQTVWKRHHRWSLDGTYAKVFLAVQDFFGPLPDQRSWRGVGVDRLDQCPGPSARRRRPGDRWTAAALTGGGTELHDSAA